MSSSDVSFLFDLDGTLVDSVYQHVQAWQEALHSQGIELSVWRIHRKVGMSGGLFTEMLLREIDVEVTPALLDSLQRQHAAAYARHVRWVRPLPGAVELLRYLTKAGIPWTIATSGRMSSARFNLDILEVDPAKVPVVTRDDVRHAKPDPDLFVTAASRLGVDIQSAVIVGDSIWDMLAARRARGLGVGLLSGGYGQDELERSGAIRVYEDPADLLRHIDEIGGRAR
ncbi:MAG TPA: HAD family hydrolase [Steroidobacteraceae bacterium]|nr:HAD family hydrolase [Steroidobacteraceae bacterium]